jgi:hypothetical protein
MSSPCRIDRIRVSLDAVTRMKGVTTTQFSAGTSSPAAPKNAQHSFDVRYM